MREDIDQDLIDDDREKRFNVKLHRKLASCGDREYPKHLAQQDILEGVVDISEGE